MKYVKYISVLVVIIVIAVLVYKKYQSVPSVQLANPNLPMETITIGSTTLQVEVASTDAEREQGLSDRSSLATGKGMLFVFNPPQPVGFWMKDMEFSLDMVFADQHGVITKIDTNVSPATYPEVFPSGSSIMYVLEIPAGYAQSSGIAIGQKIVVQ